MPIQLTSLRGEEFIRKVLHGDRYFTAVRLEEGFDFTKAEDYSTLRRYLEKNSHRKLDVTDSEFRYTQKPRKLLTSVMEMNGSGVSTLWVFGITKILREAAIKPHPSGLG